MKMEQTESSKMSAHKIQTPENYPEESIQRSEHGEGLKLRILIPVVSQFSDVTEHLSCQFIMHGMNNMKISNAANLTISYIHE